MSFENLSYKSAAKKLNDMTYTDYFYRLMLLARSVFKWNNLPNGIDEKWIEKYLFFEGRCIFFKHPQLGFMVARTSESNILNHYDEPTKLMPVFTNQSMFDIRQLENNEECILIRNNDIMFPTYYTIKLFALRLTDLQRTIDVNVNAQKTPLIVKCREKQKLSFKNAINKRDDNEIAIYGDPDIDLPGSVEALRVDAPIVFDKLQHQKHTIWNECMTFLGINNANMDKRERLVDDEVQANDEQIQLSADVMLKARELACERINSLFGTNISVELRNPLKLNIEGEEGIPNE